VALRDTTERIAARIFFKALRAGSGTRAKYSSTFLGGPVRLAGDLLLRDFVFFTQASIAGDGQVCAGQ